jgi:hypothetical protein
MSFSYCHTVREPINHFSYHLIGTHGLIRYDRDGWHFELRSGCGTDYFPGADEKNFAGCITRSPVPWKAATRATCPPAVTA